MRLAIDIVTLFPGFFEGPLGVSLVKKACAKKLIRIDVHDLRDYTHDRHKTADDKPFGGGPGMVMKPEPLFECVETIKAKSKQVPWVVLLDPQGEPMSQKLAGELAAKEHLVFIAGHYEGVDNRVREYLADQEISVGDFVTMGGEAPLCCVVEAVIRLIPGVIGNKESVQDESFQAGQLEYPQYTRPRNFRGWEVPDVLVSGHHKEVKKWRGEQSLAVTRKKRPDLLKKKHKPFLDDKGEKK